MLRDNSAPLLRELEEINSTDSAQLRYMVQVRADALRAQKAHSPNTFILTTDLNSASDFSLPRMPKTFLTKSREDSD